MQSICVSACTEDPLSISSTAVFRSRIFGLNCSASEQTTAFLNLPQCAWRQKDEESSALPKNITLTFWVCCRSGLSRWAHVGGSSSTTVQEPSPPLHWILWKPKRYPCKLSPSVSIGKGSIPHSTWWEQRRLTPPCGYWMRGPSGKISLMGQSGAQVSTTIST